MSNVFCPECRKRTNGMMYCSSACKQKAYRKRKEKRKIMKLYDLGPDESHIVLSEQGAKEVSKLAKQVMTFPPEFTPEEIARIKDPDDRIFFVRWARALRNYFNGPEIWKVSIGWEPNTEFESKYHGDKKFKAKVRREARSYQNTRGMARLKVS